MKTGPVGQELTIPLESWIAGRTFTRLHQEFEGLLALFHAQPHPIQFFLASQAEVLAEALVRREPRARFFLPAWVLCNAGDADLTPLPGRAREQIVGGLIDRISSRELRTCLEKRLADLERDQNQAVSTGAKLVRFATALHLVHGRLPSDSMVAATGNGAEPEALVLPEGKFSAGFIVVEGRPASLEPLVRIFRDVVALAPYIVASQEYQQKKYRLLRGWIGECRALARYETMQIIQALHRQGKDLTMLRGLRISLPYFDDRELELKLYEVTVAPACRIEFEPFFVAAAAQVEREKIAQDDRFSPTTRHHLLELLRLLEASFQPGSLAIPVNN